MAYLMKCGHVSNAERILEDGSQVHTCAICYGFHAGAEEVERECKGNEGLEGRKARCVYFPPRRGYTCKGEVDSRWELPFFKYQPDKPYDEYYCGCWGWD
jgi:hypothetical protein